MRDESLSETKVYVIRVVNPVQKFELPLVVNQIVNCYLLSSTFFDQALVFFIVHADFLFFFFGVSVSKIVFAE